jgi:FixJ family two-component response regulator
MRPIIYILDDDKGVRASLSWLVESVGLVARAYGSAAEFFAAFEAEVPACLVLDVRMPEVGGFDVQLWLREHRSRMPVIFVSGHGDIPMSVRAMKHGAFDFIEKPYNSQELLERIQAAARAAAAQYGDRLKRQRMQERLASLSQREREVLSLVVEGKTSKLIARQLKIAVKTVEVHRSHVRKKLGSATVAELVRDVLSLGDLEL